ncbi:hypothetical protein [Leeia aquatica]|uniref:Uncharacterized protein n=1 Tax=Leeia aquatica TaxID=2725557 RepID=A0A847SAJ5_9NEIS|nr:hypothetical protein [Leeia aquatica]NLR74108.1 hypothetical protein [Leeia aquatica]
MRGTIIAWNGESGTIAAAEQRFEFDIKLWQGNVAPKPDMTVLLSLDGDTLTGLAPVAEGELAKEKMAQLGTQGVALAKIIGQDIGKDVAIAYGVFAIVALFLPFLSGNGFLAAQKITLAEIVSAGVLLVLLASASIAVPHFWKHKLAPLALCAPLLVTLLADIQAYRVFSSFNAGMDQLANALGEFSRPSPFSLSLGFYLAQLVAGYIAYRGVTRYLKNKA